MRQRILVGFELKKDERNLPPSPFPSSPLPSPSPSFSFSFSFPCLFPHAIPPTVLVRAGYPLGEALVKFVTLGEVTAASVVLTWGWKIEKVTEAYNIAKSKNHPTLIALLGAIMKDNSKEPREASKLLAEVMNKTTTTATIPTIQKSSSSSAIPTTSSSSSYSSSYSSLSFPAALTSKGKTGLASSTSSSAQTTTTTTTIPTREELSNEQLQGEHLHLAVRLRLERTMSYMIEELGVDIYATDANGKTSLQVAEALNKQTRNHQSVIRLLQEQGVVKEREQKEETRFQNILENLRKCQGDTTSSSPHFIREQKELRNRLVAVTEEDPLMSAVRSLEPLRDFLAVFCGAPPSEHSHSQMVPPSLGSLSFSAASTSASNLSLLSSSPSFLPQFLAPQRLLDFEAQENRFVLPFWHKKDELTPEQPLFKRITELLTSIRDLQNRCPTTEKGTETRAVLESIARQYRLYVSNLCSKPPNQRKELMEIRPVARCTSIGTRFLKPDFVRSLLLASSAPVLPVGSPVSAASPHASLATFSFPRSSSFLPGTSGLTDLAIDPYQGSHSVFKFGNIHFKLNPHAPGMEYMVNSIGNLVAGQGTPPTELVRADVEGRSSS
jgi:hypothetical protein